MIVCIGYNLCMRPSTLYVQPVKVPDVLMVIAVLAFARICMELLGYGTAPLAEIVVAVNPPVEILTSGIVAVLAVFPSSVKSTWSENDSDPLVVTRIFPLIS